MIEHDPVGTAIVFVLGAALGLGLPLFGFVCVLAVDDFVRGLFAKGKK